MEHPEQAGSQFLFYASHEGDVRVQVIAEGETVWASQKGMAEIFGVEVPTINYHLKEIFKSNELDESSVIRKFRITAADGKAYLTNYYNLDAIISVGCRVNSSNATKFRIWATGVLKEYLIKGFALNDDRLKQGNQLLERRKVMTMAEWAAKLDDFLRFNEYEVLANAGRITADSAKKKAEAEYEKFRIVQDKTFRSDFDKMVIDIKATGELPSLRRRSKKNQASELK